MRYSEVKTPDDLSRYLDQYRGSGIGAILSAQLSEDMQLDDAHAFIAFGDFINNLLQHHAVSTGREIDDHAFKEIKELIRTMVRDPKYSDYREFLEDKLVELDQATK